MAQLSPEEELLLALYRQLDEASTSSGKGLKLNSAPLNVLSSEEAAKKLAAVRATKSVELSKDLL
jgi:hypothetical protein